MSEPIKNINLDKIKKAMLENYKLDQEFMETVGAEQTLEQVDLVLSEFIMRLMAEDVRQAESQTQIEQAAKEQASKIILLPGRNIPN